MAPRPVPVVSIAVAAPHPAAVDAARTVIAAGGGVIDAALAAAAALTVAYPHQCSIGGDLVALVRSANGEIRTVLSAGAAAAAVDVAALRAAGERMPPGGAQTVTVPGVVAGWAALAEQGARLSLTEILAPAVALARYGVSISPGLGQAIRTRLDVIRADPGLSALLLDATGEPRPTGAVLYQPALATTLETLAADWTTYYTGPIAQLLVSSLNGFGSPLSTDDFAVHRAELVEPLVLETNGVRWSVAPPPHQGVALLSVLGAGPTDAPATLTAARSAELRRDGLLGDPRTGPVDVDGLLGRGDAPASSLPLGPEPSGDTVAVSVVDDQGRAVSLIQSVFQSFGSGLLDPVTGVVFHNRGSTFSLDPAHPGRLHPGSRPPHTLCPTIGVGPDTVVALGCQGGRAQPWILAQLAKQTFAGDLTELLARPRWVIGSRDLGQPGPTLLLEPGVADADALAATARELGLAVVEAAGPVDDAGHVQVTRSGPTGLAAGSDPRADGRAEIVGGPG